MTYNSTQIRVFFLSYFTYLGYFVSREPYSLVKMTLLRTWAPFNEDDGWLSIGVLDTAFLVAYAVGVFIVGFLSEKFDSLHILVGGCLTSGITTFLYGLAAFWDVHNYWYFLVIRILNGFAEACGWPTLVKLMDFYFSKEDRFEFIMVAFGSCKFAGVMFGSILSSFNLSFGSNNWGYPFIWCGIVISTIGIVDFFFLPSLPPNMQPQDETQPILAAGISSESNQDENREERKSMDVFLKALNLPGIIEFSLHLFFIKLSVYVIVYWLPSWLETLTIQDTEITYNIACWLTAVWGLGGLVGTLLIGFLVQRTKMYGVYSFIFSALAAGIVFLYIWYSSTPAALLSLFIILLLLLGTTQNPPYALSSACMPSVINKMSTSGDDQLVGMATGIIDGFGSLGAIFGPLSGSLLLQYTSQGWMWVFVVVAVAMFVAAIVLSRQVMLDQRRYRAESKSVQNEVDSVQHR